MGWSRAQCSGAFGRAGARRAAVAATAAIDTRSRSHGARRFPLHCVLTNDNGARISRRLVYGEVAHTGCGERLLPPASPALLRAKTSHSGHQAQLARSSVVELHRIEVHAALPDHDMLRVDALAKGIVVSVGRFIPTDTEPKSVVNRRLISASR